MSQKAKVEPSQDRIPIRCQAKTRNGFECPNFARPNGRCRLHGGLSTGPKTPEGLERSKRANWKHGFSSQQFKKQQRGMRETMKLLLSVEELAELSPLEIQRHFEALNAL